MLVSKIREWLWMLVRTQIDTSYDADGVLLTLPPGHMLPTYQRHFQLYDRKVGVAAAAVSAIHPQAVGIDVGANVGDSAAMIRSRCTMPLLCVEGDPHYYAYLLKNADGIGGIACVQMLVGAENNTVQGKMQRARGTGELVDGGDWVSVSTLPCIVDRAGLDRSLVRFIKIDTDGFDFDTILGSESLLKASLPTLFFEYLLDGSDAPKSATAAIGLLESMGYRFIVFDNFGNTMRTVVKDARGVFAELNRYVLSGRTFGGGIPYLDVFASADHRVFDVFQKMDRDMLGSRFPANPAV